LRIRVEIQEKNLLSYSSWIIGVVHPQLVPQVEGFEGQFKIVNYSGESWLVLLRGKVEKC
jgi:hypothetical protein